MAKKFLTSITISASSGGEYTFPIADGTANQAIITDGDGNLSFGSAIASSAEDAQRLVCEMINASGSTIGAFLPVCCVGMHSDGTPEIAPARADNALYMPAIGVTQASVGNNNRTDVLLYGKIENVNTTAYQTGDTLYVAPTGGWTTTRPTGTNYIQAVLKVGRVHANNGSGGAFGAGKYEDLPNLGTGNIWVGDSSSYPVATSIAAAVTAAYGYTPADDSGVVKLTTNQTVAGVKTFTSVVNAPTLSLNGGVLAGNNIVSMRSNPTGGQFRIEKSDGSLSAYPFYIGADGTALAYYYNASGALKVLLHTDNTSYFGNSLSVGYSTYATTSYMLDVNGTARFTSSVNVQNFLSVSSASTLVAPSSGKSIEMVYRTDGSNDYAFIQTYDRTNSVFKQLRITGSTLILNEGGGNVGFGLNNPQSQLHLNGTVTFSESGYDTVRLHTITHSHSDGSNVNNWLSFNVSNGSGVTNTALRLNGAGQLRLNSYTASSSFSGTATGYLAFDSSGNVITVAGVAATDDTKLPLAGGSLTGRLNLLNTDSVDFALYHGAALSGSARIYYSQPSNQLRIYATAITSDATTGIGSLALYNGSAYKIVLTEANVGSYALSLSGGVMTGSLVNNTDGAVLMESNASENNNWLWKESAKAWGLFWFNKGTQSGQVIGSYTTIGAELMFMGGSNGIAMPSNYTGYYSGSYIAAMISNYTGYIWSASTIYAAGDMRAPIFYDANDTGYYGNFASTSRLNGIYADYIGVGQDINTSYRLITNGSIYLNSNGNGWAEGVFKQRRSGGTFYDVIDAGNIGSQSVSYASNAGLLNALSNYVWNNSSAASTYHLGISASFVRSEVDGFPSYGSVMTVRTYGGAMGTLQLYTPYSPTYGGTRLVFRYSNYDTGNWTGWKYLLNSENDPYAYNMNQYVRTTDSPSFQEGTFGTTGGATNQGIQIHYQNYASGYGRIRFYQSDSNHMTIHAFSNSWQSGSLQGHSTGAINIEGSNGVTFGAWNNVSVWIDNSGIAQARNSFRAPIFYDSADTTYYVDPAGNGTRAAYLNGNLWINPKSESYGEGIAFYMPNQSTWGGLRWVRSTTNFTGAWAFGYFGNEANNDIGFHNGTNGWRLDQSFNMTTAGSVYSGSWIYTNGNTGWYNNTYGQGLRQTKGNVSYGNIITYGENYNGWAGYVASNGVNTTFMSNSSGTHGFYQENGAGWTAFYNYGYACWGLGTDATDPAYSLHITKYGGSNTGWIIWSDRRIKENIKTIDNALDKVLALRGVYYNKIDDPKKERQVGYIAQEVKEVVPELVVYSEELDIYNMNYAPMVGMLTEAIKEHYAKTETQQAEIESLKQQVQTLLTHINNGI